MKRIEKLERFEDIREARTYDLDVHKEVILEFRERLKATRLLSTQRKVDQLQIKKSTLDLSFRFFLDEDANLEDSLSFWSNGYSDQYLIGLIDKQAMASLRTMVGFHENSRYGFEIEGSNEVETFLIINQIADLVCSNFDNFMNSRCIYYRRMFDDIERYVLDRRDRTSDFDWYFDQKKHSVHRNIDPNTISSLRHLVG